MSVQLSSPIVQDTSKGSSKKEFYRHPIFLAGCGRSGTTLMLSILGADPALHAIPEETEVFKIYHRPNFEDCLKPGISLKELQAYAKQLDRRLPRHCLARAARHLKVHRMLRRYPAPALTARHWVEKTPIHIRTVDLIRSCYGGRARFIELVRDGRDVILSRHPNQHRQYHIHPERWVFDVAAGMAQRGHSDLYTVRYEDLITRFDETIAGLYAFLGRPVPAEVQNFSQTTTLKTHDAWPDGVRPLSASSIGKWRKPEHAERVEQLLALPLAKQLLKQNGYEIET